MSILTKGIMDSDSIRDKLELMRVNGLDMVNSLIKMRNQISF